MFIIQLTYNGPLAEVDQLLDGHRQFLEKYYAAGVFLLSGRKEPRTGGVILARAESAEKLQEIVAEDPFNRQGVAEYDITEFLPTMACEELKYLIQ